MTILWDNTQKNKDVTTETPPNVSVVTVSGVTILDTFEAGSKMLIGTWLASTVLNSGIHIKTKCYGITPQKVCLIAEKSCSVGTCLKVTHRFFRFLTHLPQNDETYSGGKKYLIPC